MARQSTPYTNGTNTAASALTLPGKKTLALLLAVISFLVYSNTINNGYVLDDLAVIKQNRYVNAGVESIPALFTSPYLKGFKRAADTAASNDLYRPISLVMFAAEYQLANGEPMLSHLVNVLIFAACVVLLFIFLYRLFGRQRTDIAFVAALLFALHPIHTEVVANIKSRDELLCFFFAFSALLLFMRYGAAGGIKYLVGGGCCYLLSLMSKETSISFLAIIPAVFFWYINNSKKCSAHIVIAATVAAAAFLTLRFAVLRTWNANHPGIIDFIENQLAHAPSAAARVATQLLVLGYYIRLLSIPYPLCSDYAFQSIPFASFGSVLVWVSVAVYAALIALAVARWLKNRKDPLAFGIFFFMATLAIFSNMLFLIGAVLAERFLFFASAGFCLAVACGLCYLFDQDNVARRRSFTLKPWWVLAPVCFAMAIITFNRNADWKDNYTLFTADVHTQPGNARLWHSLGFELTTTVWQQETDPAVKKNIVEEGMADYRRSLAIYPGNSIVEDNLGNLFANTHQYDSAEIHLKKAISLNRKEPIAVSDLGAAYFAQQKYRLAINTCKAALAIEPLNTAVMNNIGIAHLQLKEYDSAMLITQKVLTLDATDNLAKVNMAAARKGLDLK